MLMKHVNEPAPDLRTRAPGVPPEIAAIVIHSHDGVPVRIGDVGEVVRVRTGETGASAL